MLKDGKNLKIFYLYILTSYNLFDGLNREVRIHFSLINNLMSLVKKIFFVSSVYSVIERD